jgi:hypothetical protein
MKNVRVGLLASTVAAILAVPASLARADDEVEAKMVACPTKAAIGDVQSCGKVWKLRSGEVELDGDGSVDAKVKGLVLDDPSTGEFNGTPDGVDAVALALLCAGPDGHKVAAQTEPVPLSKKGDAQIRAKLSLPGRCIAPIIVLRERYEGKIGGWLAATGM